MNLRRLALASILVAAVTVNGAGRVARGAEDPTVVSAWKTSDVRVDGRTDDWPHVTAIPKAPSVGATNDDEFLYLVVASGDTTIRRTLGPGLVVWLDPTGGRKADVGLQLPASLILPPGARFDGPPSPDAQPMSPAPIDEIDWLGPGKRRRLLEVASDVGVALASGTEAGTLAYELKLPLSISPTHPFAVGAQPGRTIAVGLYTPEVPKLARRREPLEPISSGGYNPYNPYGVGGYGGISTGQPPPPMLKSEPSPEKPPTLKLWVRVQLAARR